MTFFCVDVDKYKSILHIAISTVKSLYSCLRVLSNRGGANGVSGGQDPVSGCCTPRRGKFLDPFKQLAIQLGYKSRSGENLRESSFRPSPCTAGRLPPPVEDTLPSRRADSNATPAFKQCLALPVWYMSGP
ncbi:hypothetical protein AVEN_131102-1 [Araneus ventricosus]|uniref:Uncharacterized protein n=1 Tax=Araneus ventricosus TaxID=182803 RepID=A0A4Y2GE31_ARAVE|nr:hypothetical protein AVEN_131102-1 [Araneus ventricosus]